MPTYLIDSTLFMVQAIHQALLIRGINPAEMVQAWYGMRARGHAKRAKVVF